jgi:tetratricopeptide (TPR) repeat protein
VALSPYGGLLAFSQADGELLLLEIEGIAAGRLPGGSADEELRRALQARDAGRTDAARQALLRALEEDPGHVAACEALIALDDVAREEALAEVNHLAGEGRFAESLARLEAARELAPGAFELPRWWTMVLDAAEAQAVVQSAQAEADGDLETAAAHWRDLTRLDPKRRRAREEIRRLNRLLAEQLAQEGEAALAAGREEEALDAWRRAQAAATSEALAVRLKEVEVQRCVRAGIELYGQQRFAEAAFQLRKALALQPDHQEALRYLAYISGTGPQSPLSERFSRLE